MSLYKIEARRGGTHKEVFTVKCAFMCDIYGIVKVEYSCNIKGLYSCIFVTSSLQHTT